MEYAVPTIVPERRNEVWHQSDQGDWRVAYFDLPVPEPFDLAKFKGWVEKAFRETVTKWREMLERENEVPVTRAFLNPAVFQVPQPDMEGYRRFYLACRVKKTRPDLMPLDTVAALATSKVDQDDVMAEFFTQMEGFKA